MYGHGSRRTHCSWSTRRVAMHAIQVAVAIRHVASSSGATSQIAITSTTPSRPTKSSAWRV